MNSFIRQSVQAMQGYVPGEQPSDPTVIKLNTNENPYPPSPAVMTALSAVTSDAFRRYPDPMCCALRREIAALHGCTMEQVFAGNGSDEILALCSRAFVEDTGTIGFFDPSYSLYPVLAQIRNVATRPVDLGPEFDWRMPPGYEASLFYLTNPNAPTSLQYPKETVREFCRTFRGVVLLDEAYVDFADENGMDLALSLPNVLVLRTLSKSYSLAGIRCGYVVGAPVLIEAMFKIKDSYNLDRMTHDVAVAAIWDQAYMRNNVARIRKTRQYLADALTQMGFKVYPSQTNFLWAKPPRLTADALFQALRDDRIFVRYFPGARTGDFLRITVGTDDQTEKLLQSLRRILAVR